MEVRRALASGKRGLVPALWHLEIANGLATAMWRRDLIGADVDVALATIQATLAQTIDSEIMFISVGEALANARVKACERLPRKRRYRRCPDCSRDRIQGDFCAGVLFF